MLPRFETYRARAIYALSRRVYFVLLFAYIPSLFALSAIADLSSRGGFLALGFWLPFMLLTIFSLPVLLAVMLIGVLINHLLCIKTGRVEGKPARVGTVCYSLSLLCLLLTCVSAIAYTENVLPLLSFVGLCLFCVASALLFVCCHAYLRRVVGQDTVDTEPEPHRLSVVKRVLTVVIVTVAILAFLLTPYSTIHYDDGGTIKIQALGYAVVKWNRQWDMDVPNEPSDYANEPQQTRIYIFPDNFKSYEQLWRLKH